jgi:hypothetical protein
VLYLLVSEAAPAIFGPRSESRVGIELSKPTSSNMWSCNFSPIYGSSTIGSILWDFDNCAEPIPDSSAICGDQNALVEKQQLSGQRSHIAVRKSI